MKRKSEMRSKTIFGLLICLAISFNLFSQNQALKTIWLGNLIINEEMQLRIAFEITKLEDSDYAGTLSSLDQEAYDIPVEKITIDESTLYLEIPSMNAIYEGRFVDRSEMTGFMTREGVDPWQLNMSVVKALPIAKPKRPQYPEKPYPYLEEEVAYENTEAGINISGTITIPNEEEKSPAILLIPGSGPNSRDEHIFGHKVFLVLADYLTRQGYVVLRVDDRGTGESTGDFSSATIADLANDVCAGVDYLKSRPEVDAHKIGLIGHSLGGDIAPTAAINSKDISFIVLMAGSPVPLYQNIYDQCEAAYAEAGVSREGIELNQKILEVAFEAAREEENDQKAKERIRDGLEVLNPEVARLSDDDRKILELTSPLNSEGFYGFLSPAMRHDLFYDTGKVLEKVSCPVLAINGDKDVQVLPSYLNLIKNALVTGGNTQHTIKEFQNKNHLFQTTETGAISVYNTIEETISPDVLDYISGWIKNLDSQEGDL